jgi:putative ABC transport system substrate-binding protein
MMLRREFITVLGGAAAAWPVSAQAQQAERVRRIGMLWTYDENDPLAKRWVSAFIQSLADLGWADGRNMRLEHRYGGVDINRIRALAQELVGLQPDIIVTSTTSPTAAVQQETRTIPIVFASVPDPVAMLAGWQGVSWTNSRLTWPHLRLPRHRIWRSGAPLLMTTRAGDGSSVS